MPDSVPLFVEPSLVAIGFGLGEELFRSGSSTHLGHRKPGERVSEDGLAPTATTVDSETRIFAVSVMEKRTLERESSAGRAPYRVPSAMVMEERLVEVPK